jgi:hypothetical protein
MALVEEMFGLKGRSDTQQEVDVEDLPLHDGNGEQ